MSVASEYSVTLTIRDLKSRLPICHPGVNKDWKECNCQKGHNGSVMVKNDSMITPITYYNATCSQKVEKVRKTEL